MQVYRTNVLKARLAAGESLFGCWIGSGSASNTEVLAHVGFDFLLMDEEHGEGELSHVISVMRAAEAVGTPCVVRAPWNDAVWFKRALDLGVDAIMVPSVETAEEAAAVVRACRYPPEGTRGYAASIARASNYGLVPDYIKKANGNLLIIVQIESAKAVENAAEICAVEGVDLAFIGCNDLAGSIGRLEQLNHPEVKALVAKAEKAILASGKPMGTVPSAASTWQELFERGYRMVAGLQDLAMLRDTGKAAVEQYQAFSKKRG
jgi:4-hydroxy-2-oxoheptanedioate aldolase